MKKLERINKNLFLSFKEVEKLHFMDQITGGVIIATQGTMDFRVGNRIYKKSYTDKQDCVLDKDGKVLSGGCCYDFVFSDGRLINNTDDIYETSFLESIDVKMF